MSTGIVFSSTKPGVIKAVCCRDDLAGAPLLAQPKRPAVAINVITKRVLDLMGRNSSIFYIGGA
jgi:hypothetical protein